MLDIQFVTIGPYKYEIVKDEEKIREIREQDPKFKDWVGWLSYKSQQICIDPTVAKVCFQETFLHELLHGIWEFVGLDEKGEERTINGLAPALLLVMQTNPEIVKFLLESVDA